MSSSSSLSSYIKIPVTKYQLKNGMTVLLNQDSSSSLCSYILGINTGSRHERLGITGISHMFEHLMFKGTKKYPSFDKATSENGLVGTNAFTSKDYTAYLSHFPCEKLDFILDIESDRLVNLTFSQEELDKERQAVQEERRLRVDNSPTGSLFEIFFDKSYTKHSYRWPVIGYEKDIANYSLKDLNYWYKTYYSPNNATLVISGDFSKAKVKKGIEKYFGSLKSKEIPKEIIFKEPPQQRARRSSIQKNIQSSQAVVGFKMGEVGTRDFLALSILSGVLGTGESSRLYKKLVREKQLVSYIGSYNYDLLQESLFLLYYSLSDKRKSNEVVKVIQEEIQKLIDEPINKREFEKIQNIELTQKIYSLKTNGSRSRVLLDGEMKYKDYTKFYSHLDEIQKMTPQFLQEVAKKYLAPEKMTYVLLESKK